MLCYFGRIFVFQSYVKALHKDRSHLGILNFDLLAYLHDLNSVRVIAMSSLNPLHLLLQVHVQNYKLQVRPKLLPRRKSYLDVYCALSLYWHNFSDSLTLQSLSNSSYGQLRPLPSPLLFSLFGSSGHLSDSQYRSALLLHQNLLLPSGTYHSPQTFLQ